MNHNSFIHASHIFAGYHSVSGLKRLFGRGNMQDIVLRDVSLNISQGEHVTLFGLPSAGKSTLLRLLTGALIPVQGELKINGENPAKQNGGAAGYVSADESEPEKDTVHEILYTFSKTHANANIEARISQIKEILNLSSVFLRPASTLSTTERLKLNIARAALSDAPLVMLDDTADQLDTSEVKEILIRLFSGRTVIVATRFPDTVERLQLPILLLHNGTMAHHGTCEDIADDVACHRLVDVWIEGLRYDFLRNLRQQKGVAEVRLMPAASFSGQRLRVKLLSGHYLPSLYDTVSRAPLIKIEEVPPSLNQILDKL